MKTDCTISVAGSASAVTIDPKRNSFDLLRFFAATLVLYSHQHVLLGRVEPDFFGWTTFGGLGVSIFFFLSGFLVWTSWERDPDLRRFFIRRSLRIFPALWFVILFSVLALGPMLSKLSVSDYFASHETWRYLSSMVLVIRFGLPGVFLDNPYPAALNGSLWTLPVEFLCYVSVALIGTMGLFWRNWMITLSLSLTIVAAAFGALLLSPRFISHFEMVSIFWWGVMYAHLQARPASEAKRWTFFVSVALLAFFLLGARGSERTGVLLLAAALVLLAQHAPWGAWLTARLGDLSYGMYIFAFPVQQIVVQLGRDNSWSFTTHLSLSFLVTSLMAYASWHVLERPALRFKPKRMVLA